MDTSAKAVEAREKMAQDSFDKIEAALESTSIKDKEKKKKKKDDDDGFSDDAELAAQREAIAANVAAAMESSADGDTDGAVKALMACANK